MKLTYSLKSFQAIQNTNFFQPKLNEYTCWTSVRQQIISIQQTNRYKLINTLPSYAQPAFCLPIPCLQKPGAQNMECINATD